MFNSDLHCTDWLLDKSPHLTSPRSIESGTFVSVLLEPKQPSKCNVVELRIMMAIIIIRIMIIILIIIVIIIIW